MHPSEKRIFQIDFDDDADQSLQFIFKNKEAFPRCLIIQLQEEKEFMSLSLLKIEKTIASLNGTPKSVKKIENKTLLLEQTRRSQADNRFKTFTL